MNKHSTTLLFLAFTGALIFNYGTPSPASKPEPQTILTTQARATAQAVQYNEGFRICPVNDQLGCAADCPGFCPSTGLKATIAGYFGGSGDTPGDPLGVPSDLKAGKLQFLIATIPDPVHTHLSLFFDESVDAVEQAISGEHYIFARAETPWDTKNYHYSSDFSMRLRYQAYQEAKETMPGLLIFRRQFEEGIEQSLFAFLVAEVPTEGINKEQFRNALRAIEMIRGIQKPPSPGFRLRIIGPTFSGSLYSLNEALNRSGVAKSFSGVAIFSGTVTNADTIEWFRSQCSFANIQFPVLRLNDTDATPPFTMQAQKMGYGCPRIALLSENETAYGASDPNATGPSSANSSKPTDGCPQGHMLALHFPRDIASLRAAYQEQLRREALSQPNAKRSPRTSLPLNLEDTGSDDDSIATYSHLQTPLSEDEVLKGIVSKLRSHQIRLVVLRATSALDRLFLSQYLRTAYPQGRIVIAAPDRLFQSNAEGAPMRGVLALAAVPLWTGQVERDRLPTNRSTPSITFSSENAKAIYDATRDALEYPQACCTPGAANQPKYALDSLWLTVVGRDGYWPVAHLSGQPQEAGLVWFRIRPPVSWIFLFFAVILLTAAYIVYTWGGSFIGNAGGMVAFAPVKNTTRNGILCIFGCLLVGAMLLLVRPSDFFSDRRAWAVTGWITISLLILSCSADLWRRAAGRRTRAGGDEQQFRAPAEPESPANNRGAKPGQVALATQALGAVKAAERMVLTRAWFWFIAVVSVGVLASFRVLNRAHLHNIALYRYVHASSGVSPLLPLLLLLAGGFWWAWYSLKGMVLLDARRPRLPEQKELPAKRNSSFFMLSERGNRALLRVAKPLTSDWRVYVPLGAATVVALLLMHWSDRGSLRLIEGLEGVSFDWTYEIALGVILFILATTLLQLALTWLECRSLLRSLDRLPLRRGFQGLKGFSWHPIWHLSAGGMHDLNAIFTRELEGLTHLHNTPALMLQNPELATAVGEAKEYLDHCRDYFNEALEENQGKAGRPSWRQRLSSLGDRIARLPGRIWRGDFRDQTQMIEKVQELRKRLASVCGEALKYLAAQWERERGPVPVKESNANEGTRETLSDQQTPEIRLAEQFVCLIYVNFIFMILRQIRTLLTIVAGLFVFAVLSLSSYPFVPTASIRSVMLLLFLALAAVAAIVYAQMHGDSTLSRVTDTSPGKLGGDFWLRLGSAVGLPLIGLLAYQFPQVNSLLFSWLQPALQSLK